MPATTSLAIDPTPLHELAADWLIVPTFEDVPPDPELDRHVGGLLGHVRRAGDHAGKPLELLSLHRPAGLTASRLLLVGLGKREAVTRTVLHDAASAAMRSVTGRAHPRIAFALPDVPAPVDAVLAAGIGLHRGTVGPGVRRAEPGRFAPTEVVLAGPVAASDAARGAIRRADTEGRAVNLARELVNLPPNDLYPESFAQRAHSLAVEASVECDVLDESQLKAERMGCLLGVARGSDRPPRLVVLRYRHGPADGPVLGLVGKGVTFDSGGLSLKTNDQMLAMKCDMAGAAAVFAAILAIAELRLPVNVVGVLPLVENMPGSKALKLADVLKARNGTTVEVLNTDAEGRLILADALTFAVDQGATHLADLATLTGACMVALGTDVAGLMPNDAAWGARVLTAIRRSGEMAWELPMYPHYDELIRSQVADIKNVAGNRYAGATVGAKFLERFVGGRPWVHLDIAGPAWAEHESPAKDEGGTGFGVRSLVELAHDFAG